jgi:hypothetical protein
VRKVITASSQMCLAAPICAAVPYMSYGAHPGAVGFTQSVGPASITGSTMALEASDKMSPRCPKAPPPKWVSIALALACSNFRMVWIVW